MLAPHLPRCANREPRPRPNKAPQLEIRSLSVPVRGSPLIHIQPYTSAATLSLTFVSPQKGISSFHSYLAQFMYPSSQSATCHLSRCLISFREYSVCFSRRLLGFQMLWLQHFVWETWDDRSHYFSTMATLLPQKDLFINRWTSSPRSYFLINVIRINLSTYLWF